jgi:adenine-specific DNA-methyltransferase
MSPKPKPPAKTKGKTVATLRHGDKRKNLPTVEYQSLMREAEKSPIRVAYERRNRDLDPQFVWRGKDDADWSDLVVPAPPLYIQEKVHPKVLIDDLLRQSKARAQATAPQIDLFADFNGLPTDARATEFYQHDANWTNRMILGDSLQVMASLAEREGLRGKVQCIYVDPPYGIKFNSNFQWSTTSRDVKDGNADHITREPEQVKAFRDTWRDGIHSYLTYLRDRLTIARDLLADSGSIFVQIGDENVHRVRALMDEVFQDENFVALISFRTTTGLGEQFLDSACNFLIWYARDKTKLKYRELYKPKGLAEDVGGRYRRVQLSPFARRPMVADERADPTLLPKGALIYRNDNLTSQSGSEKSAFLVNYSGQSFRPGRGFWKTNESGMQRLLKAERVASPTPNSIQYVRFLDDFAVSRFSNVWTDTQTGAFTEEKVYVVQTNAKVIERCLLMTTDPGDLVLDPTCGSGTAAFVAEQWGRRWITIDTSRVALALARARIMGARYAFYLLADSPEGQRKAAEITKTIPSEQPTHDDIRHGFVYERVPHITLKSIANNAEIDVIWEQWQKTLEPLRERMKDEGRKMKKEWEEWEFPREAEAAWPVSLKKLHAQWWEARIARQKEIDASIAAKAEFEHLYDKPYEDKNKVRVAGPFTVESISPHRVLTVGENDEVVDGWKVSEGKAKAGFAGTPEFASVILESLRIAGVQQAHKEDRLTFTSLTGWPGKYICAEGRYLEGRGDDAPQKRAGILIGPEFGTVSRPDLVAAAREAADANFDVLIACAFNYDAHSAEFEKLGKIPVLKARMNPDLHMAGELKNTGAGNLFVVFGEPDIDIEHAGKDQVRVRVKGVDVFKPQTGEVVSAGPEGIACWFIDTDYNEESFFVRHAYFLGANDPYQSLKTTLKAEIDQEAWESLHSAVSRPFPKPSTGRIAVKIINHLGDEVMKVFPVTA